MDTLKAEKRSMETKAKRLRREGYVTVMSSDMTSKVPFLLRSQRPKLIVF